MPKTIDITMAHTIAAHIAAGTVPADALAVIESAITARREADKTEGMPEVTLRQGLRPAYLSGCKGRLGRLRQTKYDFYPEPGSRAYQRSNGSPWTIRASALDDDSQLKLGITMRVTRAVDETPPGFDREGNITW